MTDDYPEPKLPKTYYDGREQALAETTAEALASIHTILSEVLKHTDLSEQRRKFLHNSMNAIIESGVYLDRNLGPG